MGVTHAEILEAQSSLFADDVALHTDAAGEVDMYSWSLSDVEAYFESEGSVVPGASPPPSSEGKGAALSERKFRVVFAPRVAVRKEPDPDGAVLGAANFGDVVEGIAVGNWVKVEGTSDNKKTELLTGGHVMIEHPKFGTLLEPIPDADASSTKRRVRKAAIDTFARCTHLPYFHLPWAACILLLSTEALTALQMHTAAAASALCF